MAVYEAICKVLRNEELIAGGTLQVMPRELLAVIAEYTEPLCTSQASDDALFTNFVLATAM